MRVKFEGENNKDYIYRVLKEEIISLKIKPGTAIGENEISKRFKVSRTPIRDVFMRLSREHLLDIYPQRGSFVTLIDLDYVKEIIYMRQTLEAKILKDICELVTEKELTNLKLNLANQKEVINYDGDDVTEKFLELDNEFHRLLFSIANKPRLWEHIEELKSIYFRYRRLDMFEIDNLKELYKDHKLIVDIIESGSIEEIEDIMDKHLNKGFKEYESIIEKHSDWIKWSGKK